MRTTRVTATTPRARTSRVARPPTLARNSLTRAHRRCAPDLAGRTRISTMHTGVDGAVRTTLLRYHRVGARTARNCILSAKSCNTRFRADLRPHHSTTIRRRAHHAGSTIRPRPHAPRPISLLCAHPVSPTRHLFLRVFPSARLFRLTGRLDRNRLRQQTAQTPTQPPLRLRLLRHASHSVLRRYPLHARPLSTRPPSPGRISRP